MTELGIHDNSPLRYPGSKARRAVQLLRLADQGCRHFFEPFAGGLGTLIRARRERLFRTYHTNDINSELINFWTVLRDWPDDLLRLLWKDYRRHGAGDWELFYRCREDLRSGDEMGRAVAFFVVNKFSIRGHTRKGVVLSGERRNGVSPIALERLPIFSDLLHGVKLTNEDYRAVDVSGTSNFVFLDPPYSKTSSSFYRGTVPLTDFRDWMNELRCSWMITLDDAPLTNDLFTAYDRIAVPVSYPTLSVRPGCEPFARQNATELLILNYRRPTRDAFVRRFGWSIRKATRRSQRAASLGKRRSAG